MDDFYSFSDLSQSGSTLYGGQGITRSAAPMAPEDEEVLQIIQSMNSPEVADDTSVLESWSACVSFGPRCARCGNPCGDDVVYVGSLAFHKRHLKCRKCGKRMQVPIIINGDIYCQNCSKLVKPRQNTCEICHKIVDETGVSIAGKSYCSDHFRCAICNCPLSISNYKQKDGKFYCPQHISTPSTPSFSPKPKSPDIKSPNKSNSNGDQTTNLISLDDL